MLLTLKVLLLQAIFSHSPMVLLSCLLFGDQFTCVQELNLWDWFFTMRTREMQIPHNGNQIREESL